MFRPTSDILTTARDAIFMELRELRLRIFHPPRAAFALISRHLSSPSSMTSDDLRERSLRRRLGVVCEETHVRATIDGIDLLRASPRGKPALKEEREKKAEPFGRSRSYESYASVSAADRIKNLREKEPVRPRERPGKFRPSLLSCPWEEEISRLFLPVVHCSFVKLKQ